MFIQNERFSLEQSTILDSSFTKEQITQLFGEPKYFDLRIYPSDLADAGWYSCYIVKRSPNDQNVKFLTYLNVIEADLHQTKSKDSRIKNYMSKIITKKYAYDIENPGPASISTVKNAARIEFKLDATKKHDYLVSTGIFDRKQQAFITIPVYDEKSNFY